MHGTRTLDLPDCRPVLADPADLTLLFQPVVDLASATVAGWATLPRFPGTAGPDVWFAAAAEVGVAAELEALAVVRALDAVPALPDGTWLSVAVRAHLLGSRPVQEALGRRPDLRGVVVELTGQRPAANPAELARAAAALRERGARLGWDDTATGYAGLAVMAALRPELVRLDRAPAGGDGSVPAVLAGLTGELAGRTGARVVATGVETAAELAAFVRSGTPLAQGWLLGRPAPEPAPLDPRSADLVRRSAARVQLSESLASLLRPVRQVAEDGGVAVAPAVVVDALERPVGLVLADPRTGEAYRAPVTLCVPPSADIAGTLRRAVTRPPAHRFEPVLVTDPAGRVLGLARVEDLASAAHSA
jgi:EAL domain-containing protein (putative c-di-GMP-specific phosphodiesterase class I)